MSTTANEKTPLEKARDARKLLKEQGVEMKRLNPYEKSQQNPNSLRLAVNAKCFECVGSGYDQGWRDEIRHCPGTDCPLHHLRPYQVEE